MKGGMALGEGSHQEDLARGEKKSHPRAKGPQIQNLGVENRGENGEKEWFSQPTGILGGGLVYSSAGESR